MLKKHFFSVFESTYHNYGVEFSGGAVFEEGSPSLDFEHLRFLLKVIRESLVWQLPGPP